MSIEQYCSAHLGAVHHGMMTRIRADAELDAGGKKKARGSGGGGGGAILSVGGANSAGGDADIVSSDIALLPRGRMSLVIDHSQLPHAVLGQVMIMQALPLPCTGSTGLATGCSLRSPLPALAALLLTLPAPYSMRARLPALSRGKTTCGHVTGAASLAAGWGGLWGEGMGGRAGVTG